MASLCERGNYPTESNRTEAPQNSGDHHASGDSNANYYELANRLAVSSPTSSTSCNSSTDASPNQIIESQ